MCLVSQTGLRISELTNISPAARFTGLRVRSLTIDNPFPLLTRDLIKHFIQQLKTETA